MASNILCCFDVTHQNKSIQHKPRVARALLWPVMARSYSTANFAGIFRDRSVGHTSIVSIPASASAIPQLGSALLRLGFERWVQQIEICIKMVLKSARA
jgi:hypothetical protein